MCRRKEEGEGRRGERRGTGRESSQSNASECCVQGTPCNRYVCSVISSCLQYCNGLSGCLALLQLHATLGTHKGQNSDPSHHFDFVIDEFTSNLLNPVGRQMATGSHTYATVCGVCVCACVCVYVLHQLSIKAHSSLLSHLLIPRGFSVHSLQEVWKICTLCTGTYWAYVQVHKHVRNVLCKQQHLYGLLDPLLTSVSTVQSTILLQMTINRCTYTKQ